MLIKVLFDKIAQNKALATGWGVSFLAEGRFLFDTGEKGDLLLKNMGELGVGINKIEAVAISHDHWDHWGGLWELLKQAKGLKVYACPGFSQTFKDKVRAEDGILVEAGDLTEIAKGTFVSGEIPGQYKGAYMPEQAMVLKTANGLTVITGCAHPGIIKMIEKVKEGFPGEHIYMVFGGFHLGDSDKRTIESVVDDFRRLGVKKAGPTHCSGTLAEKLFKKAYKDDFINIKVGQTLEV